MDLQEADAAVAIALADRHTADRAVPTPRAPAYTKLVKAMHTVIWTLEAQSEQLVDILLADGVLLELLLVRHSSWRNGS